MQRVWAMVAVLLGLPIVTLTLAGSADSARQASGATEGIDVVLEDLTRLGSEAHFEDVIAKARVLRVTLVDALEAPAQRLQFARLETLAASAHLALSQPELAQECFSRALRLVPDLELDPVRSSPKVRAAFAAARRAAVGQDAVEVSRLFRPGDAAPQQLHGRVLRSPEVASSLSPTVTLRLLVDARGEVAEAHVYQPRPGLVAFEQVALHAAQDFRFEPARRDGQPVAAWVQWPVRFE